MEKTESFGEYREMFPRKELYTYYPKAEFNFTTKTARFKRFELHFKIVHNKEFNIDELKSSHFDALNFSDEEFNGVRPLHLAVMTINSVALQKLIAALKEKKEVDLIDATDAHGWTALHFARLTSKKIYQMLVDAGAKSLKNRMGAKPEDLDIWVGRSQTKDCLAKLEFSDGEKTQDYHFVDHPFYEYARWQELWQARPKVFEGDDVKVMKMVEGFFEKKRRFAPTLTVRNGSLFTQEDIRQNAFLFTNAGLMVNHFHIKSFYDFFSSPLKDHPFQRGNVDTGVVCGASHFFKSSKWPNVVYLSFPTSGGGFGYFVAGEDIAKGKALRISFTGHCSKAQAWGNEKLSRREEMRKWFGVSPTARRVSIMAKTVFTGAMTGLIDLNLDISKLIYPLYHPSALLDLVFSKTTKLSDWLNFVNERGKDPFFLNGLPNFETELGELMNFIKRLLKFEEIQQLVPDLIDSVNAWILRQIGHLTNMQILEGMERIGRAVLEKKLDVSSWNSFKLGLESELPTYDWLKDEDASLGLKRRRNDVLETYLSKKNPLKQAQEEQTRYRNIGVAEDSEAAQSMQWLIEQLQEKH